MVVSQALNRKRLLLATHINIHTQKHPSKM
jgi:hypothetical protein